MLAATLLPIVQEDGEPGEFLETLGRPGLSLGHGQVNQLVLNFIRELLQHQVGLLLQGVLDVVQRCAVAREEGGRGLLLRDDFLLLLLEKAVSS